MIRDFNFGQGANLYKREPSVQEKYNYPAVEAYVPGNMRGLYS